MKKCTYLLIKSSVLSVTDQQKPVYSDFSANSALDFSYEEKLEAFNESFIKVDNPEVAIRAITAPIQNKVTGLYDDGLYPVDGIEFEVKWHNPCIGAKKCLIADDQNRNNCAQLHGNKCQKEYRVAVLTPLKQEHGIPVCHCAKCDPLANGLPPNIFQSKSGEPGNEPKKEEQLFTKEDLRTAFEAGESHYDFQNWFIEKFD